MTGFNIGPDRTIQLIDQNQNVFSFDQSGSPSSLGRLIDFQSRQTVDLVENKALSDGSRNDSQTEYSDWKGTITVDRRNANADLLDAAASAIFHAGGQQVKYTIHETTKNLSAGGGPPSYTTMIYLNCSVWLEDAGTWAPGTRPEYKFMFHATERVAA